MAMTYSPCGVIEAGGQRRGLPEVAAQLHHHHAAVHGGNLLQQVEGVVAAAVVHENQLEGLAGGSITALRRS